MYAVILFLFKYIYLLMFSILQQKKSEMAALTFCSYYLKVVGWYHF